MYEGIMSCLSSVALFLDDLANVYLLSFYWGQNSSMKTLKTSLRSFQLSFSFFNYSSTRQYENFAFGLIFILSISSSGISTFTWKPGWNITHFVKTFAIIHEAMLRQRLKQVTNGNNASNMRWARRWKLQVPTLPTALKVYI